MRPFGVELADEGIEARLLLQIVAAGWARRLLFQGEMHALVAAVLLRMTWLDALDSDAEPEPPDGKLERLNKPFGLAKGTPLSDLMACGSPRCRKSCSKAVMAGILRVDSRASHRRTKREA